MNYDEFIEIYKPVNNHYRINAPFDNRMFSSNELKNISNTIDENKIWTLVDDSIFGSWYLRAGYYTDGEILGYFITEEAYSSELEEILVD
jgi:hypothetical protein